MKTTFKCPTPTKKQYPREIDALLRLNSLQERRESRGDAKVETSAYYCKCGVWHLTSEKEAKR